MTHLKRMSYGLLTAVVVFWPLLVWWNNVAMAEAAAVLWLKFLGVLIALYLLGVCIEGLMKARASNGHR